MLLTNTSLLPLPYYFDFTHFPNWEFLRDITFSVNIMTTVSSIFDFILGPWGPRLLFCAFHNNRGIVVKRTNASGASTGQDVLPSDELCYCQVRKSCTWIVILHTSQSCVRFVWVPVFPYLLNKHYQSIPRFAVHLQSSTILSCIAPCFSLYTSH